MSVVDAGERAIAGRIWFYVGRSGCCACRCTLLGGLTLNRTDLELCTPRRSVTLRCQPTSTLINLKPEKMASALLERGYSGVHDRFGPQL